MPENQKFQCSCCEETHEEWPAIAFISPDHYNVLSEKEKHRIGYLDGDFCVITRKEQTSGFIRCTLTQRVNDHCQDLDYGLWVSLSEKSYADYEGSFGTNTEGGKGYFGWLCNDIPGYEFSDSVPMDVVTRSNGLRPELFPHESFDHPFVRDYYNGISQVEAERRIAQALAIENSHSNEINRGKRWWEVWK